MKSFIIAMLICLNVIAGIAQPKKAVAQPLCSAYLFTYFTGDKGGEAIKFALSSDG